MNSRRRFLIRSSAVLATALGSSRLAGIWVARGGRSEAVDLGGHPLGHLAASVDFLTDHVDGLARRDRFRRNPRVFEQRLTPRAFSALASYDRGVLGELVLNDVRAQGFTNESATAYAAWVRRMVNWKPSAGEVEVYGERLLA